MSIWKKIKALFRKEAEYVDFEQFRHENLDKSHFYQLEKYKKRP